MKIPMNQPIYFYGVHCGFIYAVGTAQSKSFPLKDLGKRDRTCTNWTRIVGLLRTVYPEWRASRQTEGKTLFANVSFPDVGLKLEKSESFDLVSLLQNPVQEDRSIPRPCFL